MLKPRWPIRRGSVIALVALLVLAMAGTAAALYAFHKPWAPPLDWRPLNANLPLRAAPITPLATRPAFANLRFVDPTFVVAHPTQLDCLLVVERRGRIYAIDQSKTPPSKRLALDISARTMQIPDRAEDGLFCIAFHPEFADDNSPHRGEIFAHYTAKLDGERFNRLSKFIAPDVGLEIDPASEQVLIDTPCENNIHNGGTIVFGPDGFLYLALGDNGSHRPNRHAQNIQGELLSGILRIDPDCRGGDISHPPPRQPVKGRTAHYYIPSDNPFVGRTDALEEFYAIGLRNPWRISFDPQGRLWASDVGDLRREEINLIEPGSNCGWNYTEGTIPRRSYDPHAPSKPADYIGVETPPAFEYERDAMNRCIIGGYVYRGERFPELLGKYVYADQSGRIYALSLDDDNHPASNELIAVIEEPGLGIASFGEDANGELLICVIRDLAQETGELYELALTDPGDGQPLPKWLSETRLFDDLTTLTPADGLVPYEVNSPLWSDRAVKRRWIGLPPGAKIDGRLNGNWQFPPGTVFVKHFDLPLDERHANTGDATSELRRLETRVVVCDDRGAVYAATYRWNAERTDAELVDNSQTETIEYVAANGQTKQQTWLYPGRFECLACHNQPAGYVLGFSAKQLNRQVQYTDGDGHQLQRFANAGLLDMPCNSRKLRRLPEMASIDDPDASLETRVRSYLDANCSSCHRPGHRFGAWDARIDTPLDVASIVNAMAYMHRSSNSKARIIRGGDLSQSYLLVRMQSEDGVEKMPPLGRNLVDQRAVEAVAEWIKTIPPPSAAEDAVWDAVER